MDDGRSDGKPHATRTSPDLYSDLSFTLLANRSPLPLPLQLNQESWHWFCETTITDNVRYSRRLRSRQARPCQGFHQSSSFHLVRVSLYVPPLLFAEMTVVICVIWFSRVNWNGMSNLSWRQSVLYKAGQLMDVFLLQSITSSMSRERLSHTKVRRFPIAQSESFASVRLWKLSSSPGNEPVPPNTLSEILPCWSDVSRG